MYNGKFKWSVCTCICGTQQGYLFSVLVFGPPEEKKCISIDLADNVLINKSQDKYSLWLC